jgi:hypothetical protein
MECARIDSGQLIGKSYRGQSGATGECGAVNRCDRVRYCYRNERCVVFELFYRCDFE